jgi:hypothetical protein
MSLSVKFSTVVTLVLKYGSRNSSDYHIKTIAEPSLVKLYKHKHIPVIVSSFFNDTVSNSDSFVTNGVLLMNKE